MKDKSMTLDFATKLNSGILASRGSVVPYTFYEEKIYFLFAVDSLTGDITDFGGGIKGDETSLSGSRREFLEESKEIFCKYYDLNVLSRCISIRDNHMSSIFLPIHPKWLFCANNIFHKRNLEYKGKKGYEEVSNLLWLSSYEFELMLRNSHMKMWHVVKNFYKKTFEENPNMMELLKVIYEQNYKL